MPTQQGADEVDDPQRQDDAVQIAARQKPQSDQRRHQEARELMSAEIVEDRAHPQREPVGNGGVVRLIEQVDAVAETETEKHDCECSHADRDDACDAQRGARRPRGGVARRIP